MKKLQKLGNVLTAKDLKKINGGALCEDGVYACLCNYHFVGCFTSSSACLNQCESNFPGPGGHGNDPIISL
ncbi:hypothetical protein [uncultured Dokdonia sp.]|uniref:hypothetical protein n=1 Tax=uncultured Dokdonia sp. TaxID=575653 RepID=UPI002611050E|nr:hypothetical protein [uncultured Dokdonia sp.]